jgi:hypothetical protein
MALDQKQKSKTAETAQREPLQFRNNAEVKAKIERHKKEHPEDFVYYTRLVAEAPERAADTLILRDVQRYEREMSIIARQIAPAREWYNKQDAATKARIDRELEGVSPYYKDKTFVNAVFNESSRQMRREFTKLGESAVAPFPAPTPGGERMAA